MNFDRKTESFSISDVLWLCSKACLNDVNIKGWNGFMAEVTKHMDFEESRIIYLPFINLSPGDYNTINL